MKIKIADLKKMLWYAEHKSADLAYVEYGAGVVKTLNFELYDLKGRSCTVLIYSTETTYKEPRVVENRDLDSIMKGENDELRKSVQGLVGQGSSKTKGRP